jgi:hypothetical protein
VVVLCICSFHANWGESLRDWDLTPRWSPRVICLR